MDNWVILSLIAMLATSIHVIMNKYINLYTKNCNHLVILTTFLFLGLYSLIYIVYNNKEYKEFIFDKNIKILLLLSFAISMTILFYNICLNFAVKTVKNISYCQLIINFSIILTIILASILFKQYIDIFSLFGMLLCFIGFSIVIYNNKN
tara:strand:+ start:11584 stop:12033 length:450 start_codon:yes stop_codon:yes gene_type:complete